MSFVLCVLAFFFSSATVTAFRSSFSSSLSAAELSLPSFSSTVPSFRSSEMIRSANQAEGSFEENRARSTTRGDEQNKDRKARFESSGSSIEERRRGVPEASAGTADGSQTAFLEVDATTAEEKPTRLSLSPSALVDMRQSSSFSDNSQGLSVAVSNSQGKEDGDAAGAGAPPVEKLSPNDSLRVASGSGPSVRTPADEGIIYSSDKLPLHSAERFSSPSTSATENGGTAAAADRSASSFLEEEKTRAVRQVNAEIQAAGAEAEEVRSPAKNGDTLEKTEPPRGGGPRQTSREGVSFLGLSDSPDTGGKKERPSGADVRVGQSRS